MISKFLFTIYKFLQDSYFPNPDSQRTIIQFLKEYFTVYDADNRSPLAGAYHESASFSLAMAYNGASQYKYVEMFCP